MVDGIMDEVSRIEDKDLVTALPLKSKEIEFEGVEIVELCSVISHMNTRGGHRRPLLYISDLIR